MVEYGGGRGYQRRKNGNRVEMAMMAVVVVMVMAMLMVGIIVHTGDNRNGMSLQLSCSGCCYDR